MKTVFMVAEKPSLAASLAKILSNGSMTTRKGSNGACSVHEYRGKFQGEPAFFKFTSVCGHVMTLDFTGKYNNWDKVDPVGNLISFKIVHFMDICQSMDYLVNFLDFIYWCQVIFTEPIDFISRLHSSNKKKHKKEKKTLLIFKTSVYFYYYS